MGVILPETITTYTNIINGLYNDILRLALKYIYPNTLPPSRLRPIRT